MRTLLSTLTAAALALGLVPAHAETRSLVVSGFGLNNELLKKHLYTPFEARCQCKVVLEAGTAADRLAKLEARKASPVVDVFQASDFIALEAANKGLLQTLDYGKLKNAEQLYDFARDPLRNQMAVGGTVYAVGLVVRTDKPSAQITSWKDLWKPELKGQLLLANMSGTTGIAQLFMADRTWGGLQGDMATGMAKLAEIKGHVPTFYMQTAQMTALFVQDEAWAAPVGRFAWLNLRKSGKPLKWVVPKEGQVGMLNTLSVVKGSRNAELAHQLIDFWLSKEVQTALANDGVDSPVNRNATPTPEAAAALTWGKEQINSLVFIKPELIVRERAGWLTAWNRVLAGK
jgi:putative spermidine/putrescine transport system substrate-binding protein